MCKTTPAAYSIDGFCKDHNIARSFYYELDKKGLAPRTMRLGRRRLVTKEEAARWRERMTEASNPSHQETGNSEHEVSRKAGSTSSEGQSSQEDKTEERGRAPDESIASARKEEE
jgi:hypothetical protein